MKALTIKVQFGRVWTAETSDGKRASGATLQSAVGQLLPMYDEVHRDEFSVLERLFNGIRDSGGDGQIHHGVQS